MSDNLNHWYDGWFYDFFIAPNQDKAFDKIKTFIEKNASLIDIGCGTGRLCFQLEDTCNIIDGIDASFKNISIANKKNTKSDNSKVRFFHGDIKSFFIEKNLKYDYAVLSYVIHEIDESERIDILNLISNYSGKIIIIDYLAPHPKSFMGYINRVVEFLAGKKHYENFKTYIKNDGIKGLSEKADLRISSEIVNNPGTSHIAVLEK